MGDLDEVAKEYYKRQREIMDFEQAAYEQQCYDSRECEPSPCDDCDDRKMPVAARRCDNCVDGTAVMKNKLKACNCDHELTDEEDYRHDMYGCPNA